MAAGLGCVAAMQQAAVLPNRLSVIVGRSSKVTKGASGDMQQVECMARAMASQFGMSDVGSLVFED